MITDTARTRRSDVETLVAAGLVFHHVGFVTPSLAMAMAIFVRAAGGTPAPTIDDPGLGVRVALVPLDRSGAVFLEFVEPLGPRSPVSGLVKRGASFYHIAYQTPHIERAVAHLSAEGRQVVPPTPARAFGGRLVAFVLLQSRMLIELIEAEPVGYRPGDVEQCALCRAWFPCVEPGARQEAKRGGVFLCVICRPSAPRHRAAG